ncbi:MAG: TIM barrel protein [Cyclobacteriaceae bacterium]
MTRKQAIKTMAGLSSMGVLGLPDAVSSSSGNGIINHSVCKWCYNGKSLEELCEYSASIGIKAIDLLGPDEWGIADKYKLTCAMSNGSPNHHIPEGFNNPIFHNQLIKDYEELIPKAAAAGLKNVICFSGNRNGITDEEGLENCATGLDKILGTAQKHNIVIQMELLNSKVDHPDYQCDHTEWGVALAEKLGSPNFKLLYDIYHMQIMEGDIIATIRKYHQYIGHYHTGGVPGRNEIDGTQELNYAAIMRAIKETGFEGFVAQEFIPTANEPFDSLKTAIEICDIS